MIEGIVQNMFENKTLLITGGTGSFGQALTKKILNDFDIKKIIIFSRDEIKQWQMMQLFDDRRLRFFLGDVRDRSRLYRAFFEVDYVVHAAALKIVPSAEYDPFETVKTNVFGAMNVIDAAIDNKVKKLVALSTDKACLPVNLYGGTKLISDKLFVAGNNYSSDKSTKFSVVRYGNVMGSRGSVIPLFLKQASQGKVTITDKRMTRFMVTLEQGVEIVLNALGDMQGGETYVKKVPSMKIVDLARAISKSVDFEVIGIRPGEKLHEQMISKEDGKFTFEYSDYYKILPAINSSISNVKLIGQGIPVDENFYYSSELNSDWMSSNDIQKWIEKMQINITS